MVLGLIGVLKKASSKYTMEHLKSKEFTRRGDCYVLVLVGEGVPAMMTFAWVYQDRLCLITRKVSLEEG